MTANEPATQEDAQPRLRDKCLRHAFVTPFGCPIAFNSLLILLSSLSQDPCLVIPILELRRPL